MKASSIEKALITVTKKYTTMRRKEERQNRAMWNRYDHMVRSSRITIIEAADEIMEQAYNKASNNGKLWTTARQLFYAARPLILELTGLTEFTSQYFTQRVWPDYQKLHDCHHWKVAYDARGHFHEPHTKTRIGCGTLEVSGYLARTQVHTVEDCEDETPDVDFGNAYPTEGPIHRFGAILFIEKEGFSQLFKQVELANKWDIALLSTKGQSVTAARELIHRLDIPVLTLHDFDGAGLSIVGSMKRGTERFKTPLDNVIDIGLRMSDVKEWDLASEPYHNQIGDYKMRQNGATEQEIQFLKSNRVELNAFTSDKLIEFIEAKLVKHGVKKIVPAKAALEKALRRAAKARFLNDRLAELDDEANDYAEAFEAPKYFAKKIRAKLYDKDGAPLPRSWDSVISAIADEDEA